MTADGHDKSTSQFVAEMLSNAYKEMGEHFGKQMADISRTMAEQNAAVARIETSAAIFEKRVEGIQESVSRMERIQHSTPCEALKRLETKFDEQVKQCNASNKEDSRISASRIWDLVKMPLAVIITALITKAMG